MTAVQVPRKAEPACAGKPFRKVLVTAFPLHYPEQIKSGEFTGWAQVTGGELAQRLAAGGKVRVAEAAQRFPFADSAPVLERNTQGVPLIVGWAAQDKAQYVVAGTFLDLGTASKWAMVPERQLAIEAYLYDGGDGRLLARKEFSRQILVNGALPKNIAPGTRAFAETRFGKAYNELLDELGQWVEETASCQPFAIRVMRVEGRRLHLDAGRDSGIAAGMELASTPEAPAKPAVPGMLRTPLAVVKEVQAAVSIAEIPLQRTPPTFKPGDVLYVPERNKP